MRQILTVKGCRIHYAGGVRNHRIPKRYLIQARDLDSRNHVAFSESHDSAARQFLDLTLRKRGIDFQFPRSCGEIFLHYLQ